MLGRKRNAALCSAMALFTSILALCGGPSAYARNQWDINHGASNPPIDPRFVPGAPLSGYVPQFDPSFWKGQLASRVPAGTVLTTILEDDLSSAKNQQGDVFTLTLEDGFAVNGKMLIPPKSKIIGTVIAAASAKSLRNGTPGNLQVSLQSLIFPDGSHTQIFGFVDSNPSSHQKKARQVQNMGHSFSDYGQSLAGMGFSLVSGIGFMHNIKNRGLDFEVNRGESIPVRLSRSLEIPQQQQQRNNMIAQPPGPPGVGGDSSSMAYPQGAGGPYQGINNAVPGLVDPQGPVNLPPQALQPQYIPQQQPQPPPAPPGWVPMAQAPKFQQNLVPGNPNAMFQQPVNPQSLNDLPDPF